MSSTFRAWGSLAALGLLAATAEAGRRRPEAEADATVADAAAPKAASGPWFSTGFPIVLGELPTGLASLSAQGCAACHPDAAASWSASAHAGPPPAALLAAATELGQPSCTACHLPIQEQQPWSYPFSFSADVSPPSPRPYSATLWSEGVSCVVCHLRDGAMVSTSVGAGGPHASRALASVGSSEGCAACHQLEVDGQAIYDTYGEWSRSPYAAAGVGCAACHGAGRDGGGDAHATEGSATALTVLVDLAGPQITRGRAFNIDIRLQNTGAGHHWPSGGPYTGARLTAAIHAPSGEPIATWSAELAAPPNGDDTRVAAGETRALRWEPTLPTDAPSGPLQLHVRMHRTVRGEPTGEALLEQLSPLIAD
jgi:hypothetical protein